MRRVNLYYIITLTLMFVPFFFLISLKTVSAGRDSIWIPLNKCNNLASSGFGDRDGVMHKGVDLAEIQQRLYMR